MRLLRDSVWSVGVTTVIFALLFFIGLCVPVSN